MYPDSKKNLNYETEDTVYWFTTAFDPLNNWSAHAVNIWDKTFPTAEHAYHYRKYSETKPEISQNIQGAQSPWAAMQIDRQNKQHRRKDWNEVKVGITTEIVEAKVGQNEDVLACLLKTGTKKVVENSPWDSFWGIGDDGQGQNHMGQILMNIRATYS